MAIGIPRFGYVHALRARPSGLAIAGSPSSPERLHDDRARALVTIAGGSARTVDLDRGATALRAPVDRLLIPGTHNLHRSGYALRLREDDDGTFGTGTATLALADGRTGGAVRLGPAPGAIAWDLAESRARGVRVEMTGGDQGAIELGEVWWTRARAPASSIAPAAGWILGHRPALARTQTAARTTFTREQGDPRRLFGLEHRFLTEADAKLYRDLLRAVGYGARPFWYWPPEDAAESLLSGMGEDAASWTVSDGAGGSQATGSRGDANGALRLLSDTGLTAEMHRDFSPALDLDRRWLRLRFEPVSDASWIGAASDLQIILETDPGGSPSRSVFYIGHEASTHQETGWYDVYVDLARDPDAASGQGPADLRTVERITLRIEADQSLREVRFDDLHEVDPGLGPALVEVADLPPDPLEQESRVPLATGARYRARLTLVEVTA